ncbi:MAG: polysaccharide biosynthesis/export family protein [Planctomycetales bacterium]|nr:polysaccharide biosynthesis/export family protein [Planctomycetales bacterium]
MLSFSSTQVHGGTPGLSRQSVVRIVLFSALTSLLTGCAALTNPTLNGIPVRRLPTEIVAAPRREPLQTIPLSTLRQEEPEEYLLDAGDVLGIYIAGVFPPTMDIQQIAPPPVNFPSRIDPVGTGLPPSLGYPLEIDADGNLPLPLVEPISVRGLSVREAKDVIRQAYLEDGTLKEGRDAILVTLMQPRQIRIKVFRQEVGGFAAGGRGDIATSNVKQGTGHIIDLRAYENDVLSALSYTGGLPGLDAYDSVLIFRGGLSNRELTARLQAAQDVYEPTCWEGLDIEVVRIPTRWPPGEPLPFAPEDILLMKGDVLLLESRTVDFFYTGGLLPRGEFQLPRDRDLDVLEAVANVRGTLVNGAFGGNNLNGLLIQSGIGNPNPSALTVVRRTPNGGQIPIAVDLNRALRDPRERIIIQAGDVLILQETASEAVARYFTNVFNFSAASAQDSTDGVARVSVP